MPKRSPSVIVPLFCFSLILSALAAAQTPSGKLDYASKPVVLDSRVSAAQLSWLNQVFDLMGSSDFTFIYRTNADHWMGLSRERLDMILQIHDGTAGFEFSARVDRASGKLTVTRGTAYEGQTPAQAAKTSAAQAKGYLQRVLDNPGIFAGTPREKPAAKKLAKATAPDGLEAAKSEAPKPEAKKATAHEGAADPVERLMEGNKRFVAGKLKHGNQGIARREEIAKGQKPFSIVLTCSDSRLPPEILFDQGLGDLFVVRTAGEVVGDLEIGSIEYAAEHLHAAHLMVLGHERCGAVDATIKGGEISANIARIAAQIQPAVAKAKAMSGDLLDNAIRQNVFMVKEAVLRSPVLKELQKEKHLSVSTAYYDLDTGKVSLISPEAGNPDGEAVGKKAVEPGAKRAEETPAKHVKESAGKAGAEAKPAKR